MIAPVMSATHPSEASTASPGLMWVTEGKSTPSPPRMSNTAVTYRKLGETCPIHGIFAASSGMGAASFQSPVPTNVSARRI